MKEDDNIEGMFEDENFLFGKNKELPFDAPVNYFDLLESRIINKIELAEEAKEFSVLANIEKVKTFEVPANYFSSLENEIEYKAELEALPELSKIAKPVLKPLAADYFNSLANRVTNKVTATDELKEFATLYALEKENSFVVSPDYFDSVADKIKERVHAKSRGEVSIIDKILAVVLKPKFGLAFGVIVIVGISSLYYFNQNKTIIDNGDCKTLACLEKREMLNDHTVREMDDADLIDMVDVDKLDKQIENAKVVDTGAVNKNKK